MSEQGGGFGDFLVNVLLLGAAGWVGLAVYGALRVPAGGSNPTFKPGETVRVNEGCRFWLAMPQQEGPESYEVLSDDVTLDQIVTTTNKVVLGVSTSAGAGRRTITVPVRDPNRDLTYNFTALVGEGKCL